MVRLGDICEKKIDTIKAAYKGDIDYVDISSIDNQRKVITQIQSMSIEDAPSRAKQLVFPGDILVSTVRPNLNAVALITKNTDNVLVASTGYCVLRCLPNADNKYVFYFCQSPTFIEKLVVQATGASYPAVTSAIVRECALPFPPLEEQRKIAAVLDKVSDLIAKRRQQLDKLDELVKSRFVEMFGDPIINSMHWMEELIGDSCFVTKLAGFEYTQYIHYGDSGDVVMVKAQNVKNGKLNRKDLSYISNEVSNSLPRSQLAAGDVVMTYVGANIGDVAVIDDEYKYHLAPNVAKIRPDAEKYNSVYFMYMLMFLNSYVVGNSADTAKAALGMERIRKLKIFTPPIGLQEQFAAFVAQVDKSKFAIQKSLQKLKMLKSALMQEYFR